MSQSKHTPTPWSIAPGSRPIKGFQPQDYQIGNVNHSSCVAWVFHSENSTEDAKFIVRACNAHDDLVAALQKNQSILNALALCPHFKAPTEICDAIIERQRENRAALAKAAV